MKDAENGAEIFPVHCVWNCQVLHGFAHADDLIWLNRG